MDTQSDMFDQRMYEPLERNHVRILTLLPGSRGDPIRCTLTRTPIEDTSSTFVALSYAWGPEPKEHADILVDSIPFLVRPNLYHALVTLRHSSQSQRFWIDAICIDQKNKNEKELQVPLMAQIYTLSSYVLIWLGETENDSDYVMDCIHSQDCEAFRQGRFLAGLASIFKRDWFHRTWVLQEFALNKTSPQLVCGSGARITWDQFDKAYPYPFPPEVFADAHYAKSIKETFGDNASIHFLRVLRKSFHLDDKNQRTHFKEYTLSQAIHDGLRCKVTDPRDKIYGVLGLVDQRTRNSIEVDYAKPIDQVYRDAMIHILDVDLNPCIYARFPISPHLRRKAPSTPSRVLNFNPEPSDFTVFLEMFDFAPKPSPLIRPVRLCDPHLSVQGLYLGQIDDVLGANHGFRTTIPNDVSVGEEYLQYKNMVSFLLELESFIRDNLVKRQDFKLVEPLWKTLLLTESSKPSFMDGSECQHKWEMLMSFAKAYHSIPTDDVAQVLRLFTAMDTATVALKNTSSASTTELEELGNALLAHQATVLHLRQNMAMYRATQPLSDSISIVLCNGRCFFLGSDGLYGVGNPGVRKGDHLVLLFPDLYMPFILRESDKHSEMVGLAYIPPSMKKTAIETAPSLLREFLIL